MTNPVGSDIFPLLLFVDYCLFHEIYNINMYIVSFVAILTTCLIYKYIQVSPQGFCLTVPCMLIDYFFICIAHDKKRKVHICSYSNGNFYRLYIR